MSVHGVPLPVSADTTADRDVCTDWDSTGATYKGRAEGLEYNLPDCPAMQDDRYQSADLVKARRATYGPRDINFQD